MFIIYLLIKEAAVQEATPDLEVVLLELVVEEAVVLVS